MQHDEFIKGVREGAGLETSEGAERATGAVLSTLGEYLVGYEGPNLAARLPQGIAEHLRHEPPDRPQLFSYEDFVQEVADREGVNEDEARVHAKVVVRVLEEAITEDDRDDLRRQFPSEFDPLFS